MRGTFTSGALDCLLDHKIYFPYVIGVSAGGSNGLSYASRQRGRARACNIDELRKRRYIGLRYLFTQRCIMDYDYLFGELPRNVRPYDFAAYLAAGKFILVATNCLTGEPAYFDTPQTMDDLLSVCRASCSIPYASPAVRIGSVPYLDGGISDAIPLRRAESDDCDKNVVILTRNAGYRKGSMAGPLTRIFYRRYPKLVERLKRAHEDYNASLEYVENLERQNKIIVIRPQEPLKVNRLERDPARLEDLYKQGYAEAEKLAEKIRGFCNL